MMDCPEFDYAFERSHAVYLWCLHVVTITSFLSQGRPDRTYCHPLLDKIGKSVKLDKGQSDLGRFRSRSGRPGLGQPGLRPVYAPTHMATYRWFTLLHQITADLWVHSQFPFIQHLYQFLQTNDVIESCVSWDGG